MLIALCLLLLACIAVLIFRSIKLHDAQNTALGILSSSLQCEDLLQYVRHKYSGQYIDATKIDSLKSLFGELYDCVCNLACKKFILFSVDHRLKQFQSDFENLEQVVEFHNNKFKDRKLLENRIFFDTVLAYPLDAQQRRSIVSEEQNCLVVSSAGSGKTSSIVGKVEYLIQKKHVDPNRILLISFTHKAATELTQRMKYPGLQGYTFHKLALDIVSNATHRKPTICDNTDILFIRIFRELSKSKDYKKCLTKYLVDYSEYYEMDSDERSKNMRRLQLGDDADRLYHSLFPDMDGNDVKVRSQQERKICFLLTSLGVRYRYEEQYEHTVADERHSQYRPDFSIHYEKDGKPCRLYLEHYGVDEHGLVPVWFAEEKGLSFDEANEKYGQGIKWKEEVHRKYGTKLITLTSADFSYHKERQRLKSQLKNAGVPIDEIPEDALFDMILPEGSMQEKMLIRLVATFVTLLKTSCKTIDQVCREVRSTDNERNKFIVERIMKPVAERYREILKAEGKKDFTDLILEATELCKLQEGGNYDCIIVDEFQDISLDRYNFLLALRQGNPPAQLYCVGDDWQSIYRFSGSDMNLFNHFSRYFGRTDVNKIETTYRFGNPLVKESAAFIQRNPVQIKKNIHPFSASEKTEIEYHSYQPLSFIFELQTIVSGIPSGKSIFLLGRYSFDDHNLVKWFPCNKRGNSVFYTIVGREIEFMTVHKSKGLEADYVILLNCNNGSLGFPSTIADDPVLGYVMSAKEEYLFGEERRLFYVAITRAKVKTIVMYNKYKPSVFVIEHLHPERINGKPITPHRNADKRWTPKQDEAVRQMFKSGVGIREISRRMGRSQTAIIYRLQKLRLIDPKKPIARH